MSCFWNRRSVSPLVLLLKQRSDVLPGCGLKSREQSVSYNEFFHLLSLTKK